MGCPMRPRPMKPTVRTSVLEDLFGAAESGHRGGHAAIDRDLQEDLLDLVLGEAVVERAADVQLQLVLLAERAQHAEVQHRARLARQAGAVPDVVPAVGVEQVGEFAVEIVDARHPLVHPFGAEHLAARLQACVIAFLVRSLVHRSSYFLILMRSIQTLKPASSSVRNLRAASSVSLPCASNLLAAPPMNTSGLGCTCATSWPRTLRRSY